MTKRLSASLYIRLFSDESCSSLGAVAAALGLGTGAGLSVIVCAQCVYDTYHTKCLCMFVHDVYGVCVHDVFACLWRECVSMMCTCVHELCIFSDMCVHP